MNAGISPVWFAAICVAFGLLLGYAIGMAIGIATGRQQLIKRIRAIVAREHLDFDVDGMLRSDRGKRINGFGV